MKKGIVGASLLAMVLVASQPLTMAHAADAIPTPVVTDTTATPASQLTISGAGELKKLDTLDLNTVINLALNDSYNLALLQLKYKVLDQQNASLGVNLVDLSNSFNIQTGNGSPVLHVPSDNGSGTDSGVNGDDPQSGSVTTVSPVLKAANTVSAQADEPTPAPTTDNSGSGSAGAAATDPADPADPGTPAPEPSKPDPSDAYEQQLKELQNAVGKISDGLNKSAAAQNTQLETSRKTLEKNINSLDTQKENTELQINEAREGIKLGMTGQYVQLLASQKQVQLSKDYIDVLTRDVQRAQTLQSLGSGTQEDIDKANRALLAEKDNLTNLEDAYQKALITISFDLGIEYNPNIQLTDIDVTVEPVAKKNVDAILSSSYQVQTLANGIVQAQWEEDNQDKNAANSFDEQATKANTEIARQQLSQGKIDLAKSIESSYTDADTAYKSVVTAQRTVSDVTLDNTNMQIRYNAGVVTKYDFDKFQYQVHVDQVKQDLAKLQFYVQQAKVQAMENGYIAASSSSAAAGASGGSSAASAG